jgi:hypothetical protein
MFEELTEPEYAAIGRCVRTFAVIENELVQTLIDLAGGPNRAEPRELKKALQGTFKSRLNALMKAIEEKNGLSNPEFEDFKNKMLEACVIRDHMVHGIWQKDKSGKLTCVFYRRDNSRTANALGVEKCTRKFRLQELKRIAQINEQNIEGIGGYRRYLLTKDN